MKTEEQHINEAFESLAKYELEIIEFNDNLIKSFGKSAISDFKKLITDCRITSKIEFVDKPTGKNKVSDCGIFTNIFVDEWNIGVEGDSWEGYIYAKTPDGKIIKISYDL